MAGQRVECPELIEGLKYSMSYFTYIILCDNSKYYVGHSSDVDRRFERHLQKNGAKFTAQNTPTEILWKQEFKTEIEAIRREKQIKGWSKIKKENLIKGIWK
jgi:predicted GIY-YIG superfamily endonuclease